MGATARRKTGKYTKENNQPQNDPEYREPSAPTLILISRYGRLSAQGNASIIGNVPRQLAGGNLRGLAEITLAEEGYHCAAGVPGAGIVDDRLEAVADFYAVFALVGSD